METGNFVMQDGWLSAIVTGAIRGIVIAVPPALILVVYKVLTLFIENQALAVILTCVVVLVCLAALQKLGLLNR